MPVLYTTNTNQDFLVNEIDYDFVRQYNWQEARKYIQRCEHGIGAIYLHIEILNRMGHFNFDRGDHKDKDPFNNCRNNLRPATYSQNLFNSKRRTDNTTGYKGVCYDKSRGKYMVKGKRINLGRFCNLEEANIAHRYAAIKYYGEFYSE